MKYLTLFLLFVFTVDSFAQMSVPTTNTGTSRKFRQKSRRIKSNSSSSTSNSNSGTMHMQSTTTSGSSTTSSGGDSSGSTFNDATQNIVSPGSIQDPCEDSGYAYKNYDECCERGNADRSTERKVA